MATYYPIVGGGNWNTAGTWNTAPGQAVGNAPNAPLVGDIIIFDPLAVGTVTVNATTCMCASLTFQSASNNIAFTFNQTLSVSGVVTLFAGMGYTGTGSLSLKAGAALTSGGVTVSGRLLFSTAGTYTLVGNWVVTGGLYLSATVTINKTAAETITANGGIVCSSAVVSGTATIIVGGGIAAFGSGAHTISAITFAPNASNVTISSFKIGTGVTVTYTAGSKTITVTANPAYFSATCILNTSGMVWGNVQFSSAGTYTLTSDLTVSSCTLLSAAIVFAGAFNVQFDNLYGTQNNASVSWPAGQTLTVTNMLYLFASYGGSCNFLSANPGSKANLIYQGTIANCMVAFTTFTDIDASGSAQAIDNWYGTVTDCTNINVRTSADIGGGATDIFGWIG